MYKSIFTCVLLLTVIAPAWAANDSVPKQKSVDIDEIVVTGTRSETDSRRLSSTVSVLSRDVIEKSYESSLLPLLSAHVPGLFVTSRGLLGYGVSTGAAGGMTLRGIGNSPTSGLLVLIDGHPQYMGLMGHPIADAYQTVLAEKVEVVRGPASVIYGSNAMGGVINIVTREAEEGTKTHLRSSYGSFNTSTNEITNQTRIGGFGSTVSAFYNRTDGHRRDMGFEQMGGLVKLSYEMSPAWEMGADLNMTHFNASNPGPVSAPRIDNDSHITRGMTSFYIENHYQKTSGAVTAFYNWGHHRINDGYTVGESPLDYRFDSRDHMAGVSLYQNLRLFTGNVATVGIDYQHFGGRAWNRYPGHRHPRETGRQDAQRHSRVCRPSSRYRPARYTRRRSAVRPQLPRRQRMDSARRSLPASAPPYGVESNRGQGLPQPDPARDVYVPAPKPRPATRACRQLRDCLFAALSATTPLLRPEPFLSTRQ